MAALTHGTPPVLAQDDRSVSTVLLIACIGLATSLLLVALPLPLLLGGEAPVGALARVEKAFGYLAILTPVASLGWERRRRLGRARDRLRSARQPEANELRIVRSATDALPTGAAPPRIMVQGSTIDHDEPGEIKASPYAIVSPDGMAVVLPSAVLPRFAESPLALAAVIVHEAAHLRHRDFTLLLDVRRVLLTTTAVVAALSTLSIARSVAADMAHSTGTEGPASALLATLVGKNLLFVAAVLLLLAAVLVHRMRGWREALADLAVVRTLGVDALAQADALMADVPAASAAAQARVQNAHRATTLGTKDIFFLGTIVGVLRTFAPGPLTYAASFLLSGATAQVAQASAEAVAVVVPLLLLTPALEALLWSASPRPRDLAKWSLLLLAGFSTARLVCDVMPMFVSSSLMPDTFEAPHRYDSISLARHSILGGLTGGADLILVSLACAFMRRRGVSTIVPLLAMGIWTVVAPFEVRSAWTASGGITYGGVAITLLIGLSLAIRTGDRSWRPQGAALVPILAASLLGSLGFAEDSHAARCALAAGNQFRDRGDKARAEDAFRDAARYLRWAPTPHLELARLLWQIPGRQREAAVEADRAAAAPHLSGWEERVAIESLAGSMWLLLGESDRAESHLRDVEARWRRNHNLPRAQVAESLYNLACIRARQQRLADAGGYLAESVVLQPTMAAGALQDEDLVALHLGRRAPPAPRELDWAHENEFRADLISSATLSGALRAGAAEDLASALVTAAAMVKSGNVTRPD